MNIKKDMNILWALIGFSIFSSTFISAMNEKKSLLPKSNNIKKLHKKAHNIVELENTKDFIPKKNKDLKVPLKKSIESFLSAFHKSNVPFIRIFQYAFLEKNKKRSLPFKYQTIMLLYYVGNYLEGKKRKRKQPQNSNYVSLNKKQLITKIKQVCSKSKKETKFYVEELFKYMDKH